VETYVKEDAEDSLISCLAEVTGLPIEAIRETIEESLLFEHLGSDSLSCIRLWNMLQGMGYDVQNISSSSIGDVLEQMRNSLSKLAAKSTDAPGSASSLHSTPIMPTMAASPSNLKTMLDNIKMERMSIESMITCKETTEFPAPVPKYAILGCGGHAREVINLMKQEGRVEICGIYDDNEAMHGTIIGNVRVQGSISAMPDDVNWLICIGQNEVRKLINDRLDPRGLGLAGKPYYPLNDVMLAESSVVGVGTFIGRGTFVGPSVTIGKHCIIQPGAYLSHDAVVGDYVFLGGRVMMGGFAQVGTGTVVGMGVIIAPKVKVGAWSNVLVNSAVITDIPPCMNCGGVPALLFGKCDKTSVG